jgi:mono/diheme cytochrome c family protein
MTLRLAVLLLASANLLAGELTPAEKRGRHIYRHGESAAGRPVTAISGGTELGASIFACGTCHGPEGRGVAEGSIEPSDIRWTTLDKLLLAGRRRPRYDEAKLARAIKEGVDSAGNPLSPVMPRFRMRDDDLADLIAYLKRLGNEPQPGLTNDSITVTTAAPDALTRKVIEAAFKDVNAEGGIFGRTLKLAEVAPSNAFAVIGATEGIEAKLGDERVPLMTPFPTATPAAASFFLFPDLESQVQALAEQVGIEGRTIHVRHDGTAVARAAAESLNAPKEARRGENDLLFLIGSVDTKSILRELGDWKPRILLAGAPIPAELFAIASPVFIAAPALPSDVTDEGRAELHAFATRHALPPEQLATQLATVAAVKVFIEGLKRAGRELTRETLIASLEQLYQFSTGITPPITYARNRHMGSEQVYVLGVDREGRLVRVK